MSQGLVLSTEMRARARALAVRSTGVHSINVGGACSEWNEAMPVLAGALQDRG